MEPKQQRDILCEICQFQIFGNLHHDGMFESKQISRTLEKYQIVDISSRFGMKMDF